MYIMVPISKCGEVPALKETLLLDTVIYLFIVMSWREAENER